VLRRVLLVLAVVALLTSFAGSAEAAGAVCGTRSPAAFVDGTTKNSLKFQKTAKGDTLIWNTDDNRTLTPKTVRIRFAGRQFQVTARGESFTIAGQGNLQNGSFGGSLVERKTVRETDKAGRTKSRTLRTVRNVFTPSGRSQWVACPSTKKK
jgi:hypothetical protein